LEEKEELQKKKEVKDKKKGGEEVREPYREEVRDEMIVDCVATNSTNNHAQVLFSKLENIYLIVIKMWCLHNLID